MAFVLAGWFYNVLSSSSSLTSYIKKHLQYFSLCLPTVAFKCISIDLREKEKEREGEERRERGDGRMLP